MSGKAVDVVDRAATRSTTKLLKVANFILLFRSFCSS
jgi:hypothetical protein